MNKKICPKCGKEYDEYVTFKKMGNEEICYNCYNKGSAEQGMIEAHNIKAENGPIIRGSGGGAMKKCPNCKEDIAEGALKCKYCGSDLRNWFVKHPIITSILALFLISMFYGIINPSKDNQSTPMRSTEEAKPIRTVESVAPVIRTTASKLYGDYESNAIAADEKYKDKELSVAGVVIDMNHGALGELYLVLAGDEYDLLGVQCYFSEDYAKRIARLQKGQTIRVKGTCDGKLMNVLLKDCIIE